MRKLFLITVLLLAFNILLGQDLYKTPYGEKYHLSDCRMVETVSSKLLNDNEIRSYGLKPCKICKPPILGGVKYDLIQRDKSVGESIRVQCKGITQKGRRCRHKTTLANGYCYQHTHQNSNIQYLYKKHSTPFIKTHTSLCGAKNKSGGFCKRKVKGGGRCYQH